MRAFFGMLFVSIGLTCIFGVIPQNPGTVKTIQELTFYVRDIALNIIGVIFMMSGVVIVFLSKD